MNVFQPDRRSASTRRPVAAPALTGAFDPAARDQPPRLHPVQQRIQRGGVEREHTARALLDQLRDLVAVPGAFLQQRQHQHLSAALLERRVGLTCACHMYDSYIS
jgi:hypothetical protein